MTKTAIKAPTSSLVKVRELKPSHWNPPARVELKAIKQLAESMDRIGQQVPILVTEGRQIVEGHRRWAAAKYLEWDYLSACIVPNEMSEAIYAEVNSNVKKINGADALAVWIKNPSAVMPGQSKAFTKAENVVGKATLAYIAKMGLSCRVIRTAQSVARLCGLDNVKEIVEWLIRYSDTGMIGHIMKATEAGEGREEIRKAYLADKPVRIKLA
jgi:hypothetical protein